METVTELSAYQQARNKAMMSESYWQVDAKFCLCEYLEVPEASLLACAAHRPDLFAALARDCPDYLIELACKLHTQAWEKVHAG